MTEAGKAIVTRLIRLILTPFALGEQCLNVFRRLRYGGRYTYGDGTSPLSELLIDDLLETAFPEFERAAQKGAASTRIHFIGAAARVLGRTSVEARALRLLESIESRDAAPRRPTNAGPWWIWLQYIRPFVLERTIEQMRSAASRERPIALCLEGRFREAHVAAGSGRSLEDVGNALAVLGEFKAARRVGRDPVLAMDRRRDVRFVLAIELFRHGRADEALALLAELEPTLDAWERVQLALGFGGWEWLGYPGD